MAEEHRNIRVSVSGMTLVRLFAFGILAYALFYLRDMILVLLTSIVIASFINSGVDRLNAKPIWRSLAVVGIYFISLSIFAVAFYIFTPMLVRELQTIWPILSPYISDTNFLSVLNTDQSIGTTNIANLTNYSSFSDMIYGTKDFITGSSAGLFKSLALAFDGILNVALIFVISFYLSIQKDGIESFLRIVIPEKHEDYVVDLWHRSQKKIALWIRGQFLLGLISGIIIFIGLSILGVPYALLLSIIVALADLIPFGVTLAAIPAVAFGYVDGGISMALFVVGLYLFVQKFENFVIQPLVVKKMVGISPLIVILAIFAGATLGGVWGLILAIPIAVPILEFASDVEKKKLFAKNNE